MQWQEYLGELYTETARFSDAENILTGAYEIVKKILPESDLVTEVTRRLAQSHLCVKKLVESKILALECIRICKKIRDKYELGAVLRVLGEVHAEGKCKQKAKSCFEASITPCRTSPRSWRGRSRARPRRAGGSRSVSRRRCWPFSSPARSGSSGTASASGV